MIVNFYQSKGGVGTTTTMLMVAKVLADQTEHRGKKVVVIDAMAAPAYGATWNDFGYCDTGDIVLCKTDSAYYAACDDGVIPVDNNVVFRARNLRFAANPSVPEDAINIYMTTPCYLSLYSFNHYIKDNLPMHHLIVRGEPGRALTASDVQRVVCPKEQTWQLISDPIVARAVDAGLLQSRIPQVVRDVCVEIAQALELEVYKGVRL